MIWSSDAEILFSNDLPQLHHKHVHNNHGHQCCETTFYRVLHTPAEQGDAHCSKLHILVVFALSHIQNNRRIVAGVPCIHTHISLYTRILLERISLITFNGAEASWEESERAAATKGRYLPRCWPPSQPARLAPPRMFVHTPAEWIHSFARQLQFIYLLVDFFKRVAEPKGIFPSGVRRRGNLVFICAKRLTPVSL